MGLFGMDALSQDLFYCEKWRIFAAMTIELCVIGAFVAAAVVAACVRPRNRGPVRQFLLAGTLSHTGQPSPWLELTVSDDLTVTLTRRGLTGLTSDGAVSLAVKVTGFDVDIRERRVGARPRRDRSWGDWDDATYTDAPEPDTATFTLDFLASERYHVAYRRDDETIDAAFWLHVRPGITVKR